MSFAIHVVRAGLRGESKQALASEERLEATVLDITRGRGEAVLELRRILTPGLQWFLRRRVASQRADTLASDVLDEVVAALRSGMLTSAGDVLSFSRSIAVAKIRDAPFYAASTRLPIADKHRVRAMQVALHELPKNDQDAIRRYVRGEQANCICSDLGVSTADFAATLDRLKSRYAELTGAPRVSDPHP